MIFLGWRAETGHPAGTTAPITQARDMRMSVYDFARSRSAAPNCSKASNAVVALGAAPSHDHAQHIILTGQTFLAWRCRRRGRCWRSSVLITSAVKNVKGRNGDTDRPCYDYDHLSHFHRGFPWVALFQGCVTASAVTGVEYPDRAGNGYRAGAGRSICSKFRASLRRNVQLERLSVVP